MYAEEPEPLDENDLNVQEDLFGYLFETQVKPAELPDLTDQKRYEEWLRTNNFAFE